MLVKTNRGSASTKVGLSAPAFRCSRGGGRPPGRGTIGRLGWPDCETGGDLHAASGSAVPCPTMSTCQMVCGSARCLASFGNRSPVYAAARSCPTCAVLQARTTRVEPEAGGHADPSAKPGEQVDRREAAGRHHDDAAVERSRSEAPRAKLDGGASGGRRRAIHSSACSKAPTRSRRRRAGSGPSAASPRRIFRNRLRGFKPLRRTVARRREAWASRRPAPPAPR